MPQVDPRDPSDALKEVKGKLSFIQVPLLFNQTLFPDHDIKASISAGLVAYRPIRQNYTYEFIGGNEEYSTNIIESEGSFYFNNLRLGLGAEYDFTRSWSLYARGYYQHPFKVPDQELLKLQYWALNVGIRKKLF